MINFNIVVENEYTKEIIQDKFWSYLAFCNVPSVEYIGGTDNYKNRSGLIFEDTFNDGKMVVFIDDDGERWEVEAQEYGDFYLRIIYDGNKIDISCHCDRDCLWNISTNIGDLFHHMFVWIDNQGYNRLENYILG